VENTFLAVPGGMGRFSAANDDAAATIAVAGSADLTAMLGSAVAALGPIGANYIAAFAPAQNNNLAATRMVGRVHEAVSGATDASKAAILKFDGDSDCGNCGDRRTSEAGV
jgi:hypothetical protein